MLETSCTIGYGVCVINFSRFFFQTLHLCCGHNEGMHVDFLMEKNIILREILIMTV